MQWRSGQGVRNQAISACGMRTEEAAGAATVDVSGSSAVKDAV